MNKTVPIDSDERLKSLLAEAGPGEQLVLTVDGRIVARVVPAAAPRSDTHGQEVMDRIAEIAAKQTPGGLSIKEFINEGRR